MEIKINHSTTSKFGRFFSIIKTIKCVNWLSMQYITLQVEQIEYLGMEDNKGSYNGELVAGSNMMMLDYLFNQEDQLMAYQLVRLAEGGAWQVLSGGSPVATLTKTDGRWLALNEAKLDVDSICKIGDFIDQQNFNRLPAKIKQHWEDFVAEVLVKNDSEYIIVTVPGINFTSFKRFFAEYIGHLVEDEWPIEFKVYDFSFNEDFVVRVF